MKRIASIGLVFVWAAEFAAAQEEPTGYWTDETSAFYFARGGSATDGTYLYLFGGYQLGVSQSYPSYYRRSRRYDPATDTWTTLANLPIVESSITYQYNAGAYYDGQLYSFGTSSEVGDGIILTYSIANNTWSVLSGVIVPESRYAAAASVLGDLIYLSGGYTDAPSRRVDAFDPSNNSFTRVADLPEGLHLHAMVALPARNSLFVIGGMSADGYEAGCVEYSPVSDAWSERSSIMTDSVERPRGFLAAFALRNRIYATGGRSNPGPSADVFEYHPATDTWTQRASMASARYQHAAVAIAGRGYVYGGLPVYAEGEEFTPPDFGPGPELESQVTQEGIQPESALQAQENPLERAGWMAGQVKFRATISDPDPNDFVRLRVRIKQPYEPIGTELDSGLVPQGLVEIWYSIPVKGSYDWWYRIEDAAENSYPADAGEWLPAFGNDASPDLRCDRTKPGAPIARYPSEFDVPTGDPASGEVELAWTETEVEPGLTYEIEVSLKGSPVDPEAAWTVPAGTEVATVRLPVSEEIRSWRVRARDIAGNLSPWSAMLRFRVVHDDRLNHAAGDASKTCFFGVPPRGPTLFPLAGLAFFFSLLNFLPRRAHELLNSCRGRPVPGAPES